MGHSQLLLTLGAIAIFGMVLLNTNRRIIEQNSDIIRKEYQYYVLSLAKSYIDEAKAKPFFDETLNGGSPAIPNGFTSGGTLGPEGEAYPNFNDVDDFNGLAETDSTKRGVFHVSIQVGYVDAPNWEVLVNHKTRYKTMMVTVTNSNLVGPGYQLNEVFSYME